MGYAGRHRSAIWKSLVLPAAGTTLCWLLLTTLWLPMLDYVRSDVPQMRTLARLAGQPTCMHMYGLDRTQMAALQFHGQLSLQRAGLQDECQWLLVDSASWPASERMVRAELWEPRATLPRPTDKNENLLLFRRVAPAR